MAASSSLPVVGSRLGNRRLAALALCLVLLIDITTTTLVLASNKGRGRGANKGATKKGGGAHRGGGVHRGGGAHKVGGAHKGGGAHRGGGAQKGGGRKGGAPVTAGGKPGGVVHAGGLAPAAGGSVPAPGGGGPITYHGGPLMTGDINLSILFYGQFTAEQKNVIRSFLRSLENTENDHVAAVHRWWDVIESYQLFAGPNPGKGTPPRLRIKVGTQQSDDKYSIGKVITFEFIKRLVNKAGSGKPNTINVIFTGSQVTVHSLCRGKCYEHGLIENRPYLVVGNPEIECPGACGWPFQRLDYGTPNQVTVKPPNGNMGIDAMLLNFASGLAATVTNPFNTGFFKPGRKSDPVEAGTACENIFGSGAVPGKTGKVEVDRATGGSYNAVGEKGMKFMLPAVWNPRTSSCWTAM